MMHSNGQQGRAIPSCDSESSKSKPRSSTGWAWSHFTFRTSAAQFDNLHFNKRPGAVIGLVGPLGNQHEVDVNIFKKDETVVNLSAVQPVTPLMAIYQLAKIARADENIARAKAGMPVAETASRVEKNYFDLLVAERELKSAEAESRKIQGKWLTASSSGVASISTEQEKDMIAAEKAVVVPASKVKELTASLNDMLGLPEGTTLELVAPEPFVENLSLTEVTDQAMAANAEVIEAEQTAVKAHAANKISKLEYGPSVAIVGGYANQSAISSFLFARAQGYIGVIGTFTIFDFGKREHGVKESKANAEAADLGVEFDQGKSGGGGQRAAITNWNALGNSLNWRAGWRRPPELLRRATNQITRKLNRHAQKWKRTCFGPSSNIVRPTRV